MEPLGDDELLCIFNNISYWGDKRSFAEVSKQFMKVAFHSIFWLSSSFPSLLFDILPSSPNVTYFDCYKPLSNTHLKLLAQSCPKLETLRLGKYHDLPSEPGEFDFDFDDDGLCAVANACSHLREVSLHSRLHVGDAGIVSLATSCKNLTWLDLEGCIRVTDESLKAIGESRIRNLNLGGCYLVTDLGLEYLANGDLKNHLSELNLTGCDKISDHGIIYLSKMVGLIELNISWLINITDISLLAIGTKCLKLQTVYLTGCEAITSEGLRAFNGHQTLKTLLLFSCYNFCWEDVESVAVTCSRLEYLGLMKRIKTPMPESHQDFLQIGHHTCLIEWDEGEGVFFW
ncbi:putative leucine-rich repeat domain superfamily [Helianthus annuus]|nr:putative leucine-rich repeat domain superfamily [Helianthus annuus]